MFHFYSTEGGFHADTVPLQAAILHLPNPLPGVCGMLLNPKADPAVSGESILDAIHDTEAFVAANDDMIVVVFRGTSELTDWATNLNVRTRKIPTDWRCGEEDCAVHQVSVVERIKYRFTPWCNSHSVQFRPR